MSDRWKYLKKEKVNYCRVRFNCSDDTEIRLKITDVKQLKRYQEQYLTSVFHKELGILLEDIRVGNHSRTFISPHYEVLNRFNPLLTPFEACLTLMQQTFAGQLDSLLKGHTLYMTPLISYTPLDDDEIDNVFSIEEEFSVISRNFFTFDKFTEDDIRIIKWEGGKHFYAKIGKEDVVIDNKQKWDTRGEAMECAKLFLSEM